MQNNLCCDIAKLIYLFSLILAITLWFCRIVYISNHINYNWKEFCIFSFSFVAFPILMQSPELLEKHNLWVVKEGIFETFLLGGKAFISVFYTKNGLNYILFCFVIYWYSTWNISFPFLNGICVSYIHTKNLCLFWQTFFQALKFQGLACGHLWKSMCLLHHFNLEFLLSFMDIVLLNFLFLLMSILVHWFKKWFMFHINC